MSNIVKNPKISIIIPVYNIADYLQECLNSIITQSYKNLELICVDDGSSDDSFSVLEKFKSSDERLILLRQENSGSSSARNAGFNVSTGDYISYIDSDDFIAQDLYQTFVDIISGTELPPDIFMFNGASYNTNTKSLIEPVFVDLSFWRNHTSEYSIHTFKDCINPFSRNLSVWNKIYRRDFLVNSNITFPDGMKYEDVYYYAATMLQAKSIVITDKLFYNYRDMSDSGSVSTEKTEKVFDIFSILDMVEAEIHKANMFEIFKYALFQLKYNSWFQHYQYCPADLKSKFFEEMKQRLTESAKPLDRQICKRLVNHEIYELINQESADGFEKIYNRIQDILLGR